MKINPHLLEWKQIVSYRFPHLSLPQISGLATWSFGMVMTKSSSLTKVSHLIAQINTESENTVRQRLKEWYKEGAAKAKPGSKRVSLEVKKCFGCLLQWIVELQPQSNQELAIALDATSIGQNFTVLSVHVVHRSCGVPVAWKVVKATQKGSWKPYWKEVLSSLKQIVPAHWKVVVSADRGLYADWLYAQIVQLGWHPFLRINHQGHYRTNSGSPWLPLSSVVPTTGMNWSGSISCFKSKTIECTLLARWDEGYSDPWLIVTDLKSTDADVAWYGWRNWIECSYRDLKSDGWQWHKTRLTDPARAERHWLAMAVATLWMVTIGAQEDALITNRNSTGQLESEADANTATSSTRQISCFLQGLLTTIGRLLQGQSITSGLLYPLPPNHFPPLVVSDSS